MYNWFMKKSSTSSNRGFTLIELLVVVAIIGILSSVVLSSLSSARSKGSNAKIQQQLAGMRSQAELYSGSGTAFPVATPCTTTAGTLFETGSDGMGKLLGGLTLASSRCASASGQPSSGTAWAVAVNTSSGTLCVDSTGVLRSSTSAGTAYGTGSGGLTAAITTTSCN